MTAPTLKTLPIGKIKPYWRNPRDNREAVEKVKQSIQEYGYNQLIGVDSKHVIIIGHSRHQALQELGWKTVTVQVLDLDEKQAKAYRIIDNKTAEFAKWTPELITELRELGDAPNLQSFFKEDLASMLGGHLVAGDLKDVSAEDLNNAAAEPEQSARKRSSATARATKQVTCPHCQKAFSLTGSGSAVPTS